MTPLLIVGGILLSLWLLLSAPLTVSLRYRTDDTLTVKAGVPPFFFTLYPTTEALLDDETLSPKKKRKLLKKLEKQKEKALKKKSKKQKKKNASPKEEKQPEKTAPKKKKTAKQSIRFLAHFAALMLKKFGENATVTIRRCYITVATKDAANTAYVYGTVSAALSYLLCVLDLYTKKEPSRKHVGVFADFTREKTELDIHITLSLRLHSAIALVCRALWHYLSHKATASQKEALQKG